MRKFIRNTLLTVATLLSLLLISFILLVLFVKPNDFKKPISQAISAKVGRKITIKGDVSWSFLPLAAFKVHNAYFDNPKAVNLKQPFAKIGELTISLQLMPLLRSHIQIDALRLKNVHLLFYRDKNGKNNWSDLYDGQKGKNTGPKGNFKISSFALMNGQVDFNDQKAQRSVSLKKLTIQTNAISPNKPFTVNASTHILVQNPELKARVKLSALITADFLKNQYSANNLHFHSTLLQWKNLQPKNPSSAHLELKGNLNIDSNKQTLSLDNLSLNALNIEMLGQLQGQFGPHLQLTGLVKIPLFVPNQTLDLLDIKSPFISPSYALFKAEGDTQFEVNKKNIRFDKINFKIDNTTLIGQIALNKLANKKKHLTFSLQADQLALDNYAMMTKAKDTKAKDKTKQEKPSKNTAQNTLLDQIDTIEGEFKLNKLSLKGLKADSITANIRANNHIINLSPITAQMYQGNLKQSITINLLDKKPAYIINAAFSNITIEKLLKDWTGRPALLTGKGNLSTRLTTYGKSKQVMIQHLNGLGSVQLVNGYLNNIDAVSILSKATALIHKQRLPKQTASNKTAYDRITANFYINNGVMHNNNLLLVSSTLEAKGAGQADLNNNTINYKLKLAGIKNITVSGSQEKRRLNTWSVPVNITGSLSDPRVLPDFTEIGKQVLKKHLSEPINKKLEETKKKLGDKINKSIGNLFQ